MRNVWESPKMDLIETNNEDVLTASANKINASSSDDSSKWSTTRIKM